eukprot:TRINITY_DN1636_c0_g1_i18.p3 TRINITY_DN1636_c0_g1~~TRINITY_DN1636_c0_g1_i18.p3  ORF type:complete len:105 (+),score=24.17 TRINITY_DN1636_c0_g1_i18:64-378(+)
MCIRDRQQDILKLSKEVSAQPHPLDRHSGNGVGKADKKNGAGKANWGTFKDDIMLEEDLEEDSNHNLYPADKLVANQGSSRENTPKLPAGSPPEINEMNFPKLG